MTPLERAARALWEASGSPMKAHDTAPSMSPPEDQPDWERFIPQARAVIEAIREPSDAMEQAGYGKTKGDPDNTGIVDNPRPDDAWRAMIDALLEEGP